MAHQWVDWVNEGDQYRDRECCMQQVRVLVSTKGHRGPLFSEIRQLFESTFNETSLDKDTERGTELPDRLQQKPAKYSFTMESKTNNISPLVPASSVRKTSHRIQLVFVCTA